VATLADEVGVDAQSDGRPRRRRQRCRRRRPPRLAARRLDAALSRCRRTGTRRSGTRSSGSGLGKRSSRPRCSRRSQRSRRWRFWRPCSSGTAATGRRRTVASIESTGTSRSATGSRRGRTRLSALRSGYCFCRRGSRRPSATGSTSRAGVGTRTGRSRGRDRRARGTRKRGCVRQRRRGCRRLAAAPRPAFAHLDGGRRDWSSARDEPAGGANAARTDPVETGAVSTEAVAAEIRGSRARPVGAWSPRRTCRPRTRRRPCSRPSRSARYPVGPRELTASHRGRGLGSRGRECRDRCR